MREWWAEYVGLPYVEHGRDRRGVDCWGLVVLVYRERYGIELPGYEAEYTSAEDRAATGEAFVAHAEEWVPVETAREGDALLFGLGVIPTHIGIALRPQRMLHVQRETRVCATSYDLQPWSRMRRATLRHPALA